MSLNIQLSCEEKKTPLNKHTHFPNIEIILMYKSIVMTIRTDSESHNTKTYESYNTLSKSITHIWTPHTYPTKRTKALKQIHSQV